MLAEEKGNGRVRDLLSYFQPMLVPVQQWVSRATHTHTHTHTDIYIVKWQCASCENLLIQMKP